MELHPESVSTTRHRTDRELRSHPQTLLHQSQSDQPERYRSHRSGTGFFRCAWAWRPLNAKGSFARALRAARAATSILGFAHLDVAARAALVKAVSDETQAVAQRYRDGDEMTFPICTHIALAYGK